MIELNIKTNSFNKRLFNPKIEKKIAFLLFDYVENSVEENLQNYGKSYFESKRWNELKYSFI